MQSKASSINFYSYITWNISKDPEKVLGKNIISKIETEPYKDTSSLDQRNLSVSNGNRTHQENKEKKTYHSLQLCLEDLARESFW